MNEAETRAEHIDPALKAAGRGVVENSRIRGRFPSRRGASRVSGGAAQELLGHKDVKTTMIYTHALNRGGKGVKSPVDDLRSGERNGAIQKPYIPPRSLQRMIWCSANTGLIQKLPEGHYAAMSQPKGVMRKRYNRCYARE